MIAFAVVFLIASIISSFFVSLLKLGGNKSIPLDTPIFLAIKADAMSFSIDVFVSTPGVSAVTITSL